MTRVRAWASWAVVPALVAMQLFDLRRALIGPGWVWSTYLLGFSAATVLLGVLVATGPKHDRQLNRAARWAVGSFVVLIAYALVTALVTGETYASSRTTPTASPPNTFAHPGLTYRVVPLLTALVTMSTAVLALLVVPVARRFNRLWWSAATVVGSSFLLWPRGVLVHRSLRMSTGMAGSAILPLVLLLAAAVLAGAALDGHRRRLSSVLAGLGLVGVLLTGSRSGLITLVMFAAVVTVWFLGRVRARLVVAAATVGAVVVGVVLALFPTARRVLNLHDPARQTNLVTAWGIFTESIQHVVWGAGSGRVWPWYAVDARFWIEPYRSQIGSYRGTLLSNPHSLWLAVLVELGVVGLALALVLVAVVAVVLVRRWLGLKAYSGTGGSLLAGHPMTRDTPSTHTPSTHTESTHTESTHSPSTHTASTHIGDLALLAVLAGFVAFLFDMYLLKNYAVSFWWWWVVVAALTAQPGVLSQHHRGR